MPHQKTATASSVWTMARPFRLSSSTRAKSRVSVSCEILEDGPLWTTVRVQYAFDNQAAFTFECTAVEGEAFVRVAERSTCGPKSRWIVMFDEASGMLPDGIDLADHTLFHQSRLCDILSASK